MPFNPQQQAIINHVDGPCLVTAVPGSGKTTTITERTKNLLKLGIRPEQILAITFTNKAATEMKHRITKAVGEVAKRITISTFHSLCAKIIRENPQLVGLQRSYSIYDDSDQESLLKSIIHKIEGEDFYIDDKYTKQIMRYMDYQRNSYAPESEAMDRYHIKGKQVQIIASYFEELKKSNAIDFTGLLSEANRLLEENTTVRDAYRNRWKYISVDEVQDTNIAQYRLMTNLAGGHKNIVAVGDLDQSIYRFRSASPENILSFETDFGAMVLKLEKNYRSTPQILKYSQNLIEHNSRRKETSLVTDNPANNDTPRAEEFFNEEEEVENIAININQRLRAGVPAKEIAVLYRTNFVSRSVEMALRKHKIKYKIIGGLSFWDRREIKFAMAILKFLCNKSDKTSFRKAIEICCRGVADKGSSKIIEAAEAAGITVFESAQQFAAKTDPLGRNIAGFVKIIGVNTSADVTLSNLLRQTAFIHKISADSTSDDDRTANVQELADDLRRYQEKGGTLAGYLQNVSLLGSTDQDSEQGEVSLMTMHACKGLEFDAVFITHANEGIIPHKNVIKIDDHTERMAQFEEERRLMYVAMTRAKKYLRLYFFRKKGTEELKPSRFLAESKIPIHQLPCDD